MSVSVRESFKEFLSTGSAKAGSILFLIFVMISFYVLITYPLDFGVKHWSNPAEWADNPKAAPPAWTSIFSDLRRAEHRVLRASEPSEVLKGGEGKVEYYRFFIDHSFDEPPTFTSLSIQNVTYHRSPPVFRLSVLRPDGKTVELYSFVVTGPRPGEEMPISRYVETPYRVLLSGEPTVGYSVSDFLKENFGILMSHREVLLTGVEKVVFGTPSFDGFQVLKGDYVITLKAEFPDVRDGLELVKLVLGGSVYGLMGTDTLGRDLFVGLLFGFPVALFIGLVTSTLATSIGAFLGIVSGYLGGRTDTAIQRSCDVLTNIPLLPILIFLTFVLGQKLWLVILILIAFGWPGLSIIVRSMVLQVRSTQLIEASIALGASKFRIIFRHIFPQTAPFVLAQMIFTTPAAILAEAALSFLGLGDPSLPTWGQILEYGFRNGGVYVGYWWWVLPPGLLIVLTAMTFVLLALGMEPVVSPRLRRMG